MPSPCGATGMRSRDAATQDRLSASRPQPAPQFALTAQLGRLDDALGKTVRATNNNDGISPATRLSATMPARARFDRRTDTTYRKGEKTSRMNERDYPHIVQLAVPPKGFGLIHDTMMAFHCELGIENRRGRTISRDGHWVCRWCFADVATAEAFRLRFGGVVMRGYIPRRGR